MLGTGVAKSGVGGDVGVLVGDSSVGVGGVVSIVGGTSVDDRLVSGGVGGGVLLQ